jgi:hypothetical protein
MARAESPHDVEIPEEAPEVGSTPLLVSLLPFVLFVLLYVVFPRYGSLAFGIRGDLGFLPIGESPGMPLPLGVVAAFFGLAWGGLGTYLVSEAEGFGTATAAFLLCTVPASALVALAPLLGPHPSLA